MHVLSASKATTDTFSSIHSSIHPSTHPSIHPSICTATHPSSHISIHPSVLPSVHLTGAEAVKLWSDDREWWIRGKCVRRLFVNWMSNGFWCFLSTSTSTELYRWKGTIRGGVLAITADCHLSFNVYVEVEDAMVQRRSDGRRQRHGQGALNDVINWRSSLSEGPWGVYAWRRSTALHIHRNNSYKQDFNLNI